MVKKVKSKRNNSKIHDIVFMISLIAWPVAIFLVFYVYVNINMFILAVKEYDVAIDSYVFAGFKNFVKFFKSVFTDVEMARYFKNSFIVYGLNLLSMPIGILASNHIYKKYPGASAFRILLFLPSIIPGMVWTLMFRYFVERVLPVLPTGQTYITYPGTTFITLNIYSLWLGFASGMVLYTGAMSRVPPDLVEYGELDGLTGLKEFWHLTLPFIFPTITVFLVTGVAGIFTNQLGLYSFFGEGAPNEARTIGYHFFAELFAGGTNPSKNFYPYASAAGIAFTAIVAPITLVARYFLEKYGPSVES